MIKRKIITLSIILGIIAIGGFISYRRYRTHQIPLYTTAKATHQTIVQVIKARGRLEVEALMKIGSIISGVIEKMLVEENALVKKGQLLAVIDDGKEDTEVRQTKGAYDKARADFDYQCLYYNRQKVLYEKQLISQDAFDKVTRDYLGAKALVDQTKATYDFAVITFNHKQITAPDAGLVISKDSSEGETVTLASPATIIYTIAKDINKMEAKLEIDESAIGSLKIGIQALLTFDAYPQKIFKGTIKDISSSPVTKNGAVTYMATICIDNSERIFKQGMSVDARITVAKSDKVVAIPGNIFRLNRTALKEVAQILGFSYSELSEDARREVEAKGTLKTVWLKEGNSFVEKVVEVGINDNAAFEIITGITGTEDLIVDTAEPDAMKKFFEGFFGKGL